MRQTDEEAYDQHRTMSTIGIIIQARTGSSRLPGKVTLPFHNSKTIIDILIEKLKPLNLPIVLATSDSEKDTVLKGVAERNEVCFFQGSEQDVLQRFIGAADSFNIDAVIRVCADNPFIHAPYVQALVDSFREKPIDYISYATASGRPVILTHYGFFAELATVAALKRVSEQNPSDLHKEYVTGHIYAHPEQFDIRWIPFPFTEPERAMRFTIDTRDDFELAARLFAAYRELSPLELVEIVGKDEDAMKTMEQQITINAK
jgi:spore coat polysaccharide biosynthesis protein SpsF